MKEKLLTLIDLELKNLDTLDIHYPSWINEPGYTQEYSSEWFTGPKGMKQPKHKRDSYVYLSFSLKFPDGKPDLDVVTQMNWADEETLIKKSFWWFKESVYRHNRKMNAVYSVSCGHIKVTLTDEEADELAKKVSEAVIRLTEHKKALKEKRTLEKIDARIAVHNEKQLS